MIPFSCYAHAPHERRLATAYIHLHFARVNSASLPFCFVMVIKFGVFGVRIDLKLKSTRNGTDACLVWYKRYDKFDVYKYERTSKRITT